MIALQVKVTAHNFKVLLSQHKPMEAHWRTMQREARAQVKERARPATPCKAHRQATHAAVKEMWAKLYATKAKYDKGRVKEIRWGHQTTETAM